MSAPNARSTEVLTEHFGYPPIALIDDIINAVNEITIHSVEGVKTFLDRQATKRPNAVELKEEIELGTVKLETLLNSFADKNFDKFELYALRNILTIPNDLTEEGWIKLRHHEGLQLDRESNARSVELDLKINQTFKEITQQLMVKKQLVLQINRAKRMIKLMKLYRDSICFLSSNPKLSAEALEALSTLAPLDETLYYLASQTTELFQQIDQLRETFEKSVEEGGISGLEHTQSEREKYLSIETSKLLRVLGLARNKPRVEKLLEDLDNVDLGDNDVQAALKERFGL